MVNLKGTTFAIIAQDVALQWHREFLTFFPTTSFFSAGVSTLLNTSLKDLFLWRCLTPASPHGGFLLRFLGWWGKHHCGTPPSLISRFQSKERSSSGASRITYASSASKRNTSITVRTASSSNPSGWSPSNKSTSSSRAIPASQQYVRSETSRQITHIYHHSVIDSSFDESNYHLDTSDTNTTYVYFKVWEPVSTGWQNHSNTALDGHQLSGRWILPSRVLLSKREWIAHVDQAFLPSIQEATWGTPHVLLLEYSNISSYNTNHETW